MKILKLLFLTAVIASVFVACSGGEKDIPSTEAGTVSVDSPVASNALPEHTFVTFEVEGYGKFVVETYPECAPETVKHFLSLVESGHYNGFSFDKITPSKTLLSSETSSHNSSSDSGSKPSAIAGEFYANGKSNTLKLDKYTLALNHIEGNYDTGVSQFMIMLTSSHDFDGQYAGFAKVVEGNEVIDRIAGSETDENGKPVSPIVMKKVYIKA